MEGKQSGGFPVGPAVSFGGGLLGMLNQKRREKRSHRRNKEYLGIQFENQKALNEQGQELAFEMWEKTNFPAQLAMLKEAGLSPGLFYGGSGQGGTTANSGSGGGAASAGAPDPQFMDIGAMMSQAKLGAEIELLKAQAEKSKAEAEKTAGVDTKEAETRIADLTQGIENKKAIFRLTEAQEELTSIEAYITNKSKEDAIDKIGRASCRERV